MTRRWWPAAAACYALVLVATTVAQESVTAPTRLRWLRGSSTDVIHLGRDPVLVLFASALWLPALSSLALLGLIFLVLAAGERRFGVLRVAAVFLCGHILATLITEGSVWIGVQAGWLTAAHEHRLDVGPSYGTCAVLGLLVASLSAGTRVFGYAGLAVLLGLPFIVDNELTTVGHIVAAVIGISAWWIPWVRQTPAARARSATPYPRDCSSASRY
jgi:hypothetical protein